MRAKPLIGWLETQLQAEQKSKYPDQGDALDSNHGGGNNNGPGNGNMNGNNGNKNGRPHRGHNGGNAGNGNMNGNPNGGGNSNGPGAPVSAEQCADIANKLTPIGHQCNSMSDFNTRVQCFKNAPQSAGIDQATMNGCQQNHSLDSLKSQLQAEQKLKYPDQGDALDNNPSNGNKRSNSGNRRQRGHNPGH